MYKLTNSTTIIRTTDGACIPADPVNTDYQRYLGWLGAGNTPEPAEPVVPTVPQVVSRFQARVALHLAGHLPQVEALMADPATPMLARMAWTDAQEFRRTSPTVLAMATALGLTDAQVDELFTTAAGIDA